MARHRALGTALLAAAALATGSCRRADAREGITLRFWGLGREGEIVASMIPEFERRHPRIHVEVQQIPWTAAHEKLLTAFVGDASPDVSQLGNTWVPEFVALNALAALDGRVAASPVVHPDDFFRGIWDTNVLGDSVYGIPWYVDTRLLFYRTDVLRRAGYDSMPASWAGWIAAMRRLKATMAPDAYPILLPTTEWNVPVILALQAGSPILRDDGRYGAFQEPAFRRAFTLYASFFHDSLSPALGLTQISNVYQEMARARFDMWVSGPWNIGEFTTRFPAELQDDWGTAPMPGPAGAASGVSLAGGSSVVVYRGSPHQDAAWQLVEFLAEPAQQRALYRLTGDLPARVDVWEQDSALATNRHARAFYEQLQRVVPTPKVPEWEQIAQKIAEYGDAVARGTPVDAALAGLQRDVDAMLEKRRYLLDLRGRRAAESATAPGARP